MTVTLGVDPHKASHTVVAPNQVGRLVAGRLLGDVLAAGERVVSEPIDALAVARAALQEPNLPRAHVDGPAREIKVLVGHREDLVAERTGVENRRRWHLHDLDPERAPSCLRGTWSSGGSWTSWRRGWPPSRTRSSSAPFAS